MDAWNFRCNLLRASVGAKGVFKTLRNYMQETLYLSVLIVFRGYLLLPARVPSMCSKMLLILIVVKYLVLTLRVHIESTWSVPRPSVFEIEIVRGS